MSRGAVTLENLPARCLPDGDCWIWQGYYTASGIPAGYLNGQRMTVRRIVLVLQGRRAPGPGAIAVCRHGERGCVNPDHIEVITRAKNLARLRESGRINELLRVQGIAATWRRRAPVLTLEKARALRSDPRSGMQIERDEGISHTLVAKVRYAQVWREITASPWAGMGARGGA